MALKHIKSKSFFVTVTTAVLLACMMVILPFTVYATASDPAPIPPASYTDLGAAKGYNLVCFGDFSNGSTDIEGKSAIEGAINCPNGFTFGNSSKMNPSDYALVWGGTSSVAYNAGNNHSDCKALIPTGVAIGNTFGRIDYWTDLTDFKAKSGFNFSELQAELLKKSKNLAQVPATGTVNNNYGELVLSGDRTDYNIFTLDADMLSETNGVVIKTPDQSTVIINVVSSDTNAPVKTPVYTNDDNGNIQDSNKITHLIWNFSNAKYIENKNSIKGTVLAPGATFTVKAWGNFEGTMIVDAFQSPDNINLEGHNYPFGGQIPQISDDESSVASSQSSSASSSEVSSTASSQSSSASSSEVSSTASSQSSSASSSEVSSTASSQSSSAASSEVSSTTNSQASSVVSSQVSSSQPSSGSSSKSPSGLETISEESTPLANPSSRSSSGRPSSGTEDIPDESTPLTPPKTGEAALPAAVSVLAAASLITMAVLRRNRK